MGAPRSATSLRGLNDLGFLFRERARFHAGSSELLALRFEPSPDDGIVLDAGGIEELRAIVVHPTGAVSIGAFATRAALAKAAPELCPADATAANLRLRLTLRDAAVVLYGGGRSRTVPLGAVDPAPHELPVTIEVAAPRPGLGIAERRRATNDGAASHAVGVTAALRVTSLARFTDVRVAVDVDGTIVRATQAEAKLEGERCDRDLLPEAARLTAAQIAVTDERTSAIARSLLPLALGALRDAFAAARTRVQPA